jgi:hypothetical protein
MAYKKGTRGMDRAASKLCPPPAKSSHFNQPARPSHPAATIQRAVVAPRSLGPRDVLQLQRTFGNRAVGKLLGGAGQRQTANASAASVRQQGNGAALPARLRAGIENLSGMDMSDIRIHYNSPEPACLGAHAYTRGTDIYLNSGQESCLSHEAWHAVQQKQGRVRPTVQLRGLAVNDDSALERDADVMGPRAALYRDAGPAQKSGAAVDEAAPTSPAVPAPAGKGGSQLSRAQAGQSVIQGYFRTGDFHLAQAEKGSLFVVQSPGPVLERRQETAPGTVPYSITHHTVSVLPDNMLVADDKSMAINDTQLEPKEFYALPAVIEDANEKLNAVNSAFNLALISGNAIRVADRHLSMIKPVNRQKRLKGEADMFTNMIEHICIKMAGRVMGNPSLFQGDVVLRRPGTDDVLTEAIKPDSTGDPKITGLAAFLSKTEGGATAESARKNMQKGTSMNKSEVGEAYGRSAAMGLTDEAARALEVNEYARPAVGEGMATFSNPAGPKGTSDFSAPTREGLPTERGELWGYHYAGVVAKSLDGSDRVALENYNRTPALIDKIRELQDLLLREFSKKFWGWTIQNYRIGKEADDSEVANKFRYVLKTIAGDNSTREYLNLMGGYQPESRWFFRMYGSKPGQSFHEKQAAGGDFTNPMTVRVRTHFSGMANATAAIKAERKQIVLAPINFGTGPGLLSYKLRDAVLFELEYEESLLKGVVNRDQFPGVLAKVLASRKEYYQSRIKGMLDAIVDAVEKENNKQNVENVYKFADLIRGLSAPAWQGSVATDTAPESGPTSPSPSDPSVPKKSRPMSEREQAEQYVQSVQRKYEARQPMSPLEIMTYLRRRTGNNLYIMAPDDWDAHDDFVRRHPWALHPEFRGRSVLIFRD